MVKCERTLPAPQSLEKRKNYNEEDTIQALKKVFHDKCYICEMQGLQDGVPEHLIPHRGKNDDLKFDWENLFWACNRCNSIKNRSEYDGKIIDCCKIDPENHLRCIYDPYSRQIMIKAKDTLETSKMTAQLVNETFNLKNTGLRGSSLSERMRAFRKEWDIFFKLLRDYSKNKSPSNFRRVKARLNRQTAFAALKRDYIRQHQSEYIELKKYVDEEK